MADFSKPDGSGLWSNILTQIRSARERCALMFDGGAGDTNLATNTKRIDASDGQIYNWNGSAWATMSITATGFNTSSDVRLKKNVSSSHHGLDEINAMNPVVYQYINGTGDINHGLIAQEVRELLPNSVHEDSSGFLSVDYSQIVPVLIKAVQDLSKEVKDNAR